MFRFFFTLLHILLKERFRERYLHSGAILRNVDAYILKKKASKQAEQALIYKLDKNISYISKTQTQICKQIYIYNA